MTTDQEEKEFFKALLLDKPSWQGLEGSELVDILTGYVGKRGAAVIFQIEAASRENFLQLAEDRESIVARAESEDYIPKPPSPFELNIEVVNAGDKDVFLPFRCQLASADGTGLVLAESSWIGPGETITVLGRQLSTDSGPLTFTPDASGKIFQEFVIGGIDDDTGVFTIHDFSVKIGGQAWDNVQNFRNGGPDSLIYHVFYKVGDELAFRLGNGEVGKIPEENSTIEVEIWHTRGENAFVASGQSLTPLESLKDVNNDPAQLKFTSGAFIRKGQPLEPQETIRASVLSHIQQGPVTARNADYEHTLGRKFPDPLYLKVWGEKEHADYHGYDLGFINKGFFTFLLKKEDGEDQTAYDARVEAMRLDIIEYWDTLIQPMNMTAEHVPLQELPFQIVIKGEVDRGEPLDKIEGELTRLLLAIFGRYSNQKDFLELFKEYSNINALLELFNLYGGRSGEIHESDIHDAVNSTRYFANKFPHLKRRDRPAYEVDLLNVPEVAFYDKRIYLESVSFEDKEGNSGLAYVDNF